MWKFTCFSSWINLCHFGTGGNKKLTFVPLSNIHCCPHNDDLMIFFKINLPETTKKNSSSFKSSHVLNLWFCWQNVRSFTTVRSFSGFLSTHPPYLPSCSPLLCLKPTQRTCRHSRNMNALNDTSIRAVVEMNYFCLCHHFFTWQLVVDMPICFSA